MYSVCYVLCDQEKLEYYNEMLISICSLRRRGFPWDVYVLMDQKTLNAIHKAGRREFETYRVTPLVVEVPESYTQRVRSRYIKTSIRKWMKGDYLYIDTDTIIADALPEVVSDYDVALALDVNRPFKEMSYKVQAYHNKLLQQAGYEDYEDELYFNSGVMWVRDTEVSHRLYREWHKNWNRYMKKKGVVEDQPGLNRANIALGHVIHHLSDTFNVQVSGNPFPTPYLAEARVIHYIHNEVNSTYILSNKNTDKSNLMDPRIQEIIARPKSAFAPGTMLKKDDDRERILSSTSFYVLKRMYYRAPKLYKGLDWILALGLSLERKARITMGLLKKEG